MDERQQFQRMLELNEEIERFKQELKEIRPKAVLFNGGGSMVAQLNELNMVNGSIHRAQHTRIVENFNSRVEVFESVDFCHHAREDDYGNGHLSVYTPINDNLYHNQSTDHGEEMPSSPATPEIIVHDAAGQPRPLLNGPANDSGSCAASVVESVDSDDGECSSIILTPKYYANTQLKLMLQPKKAAAADNMELIITPSFTVNVQQPRGNTKSATIETDTAEVMHDAAHGDDAFDQRLSILIQKMSINGPAAIAPGDASDARQSIERTKIIGELFGTETNKESIMLQRYFLRWVHFTTIERLMRRSPEQSRLQKMQTFLQNITIERKKALNRLRQANAIDSSRDNHRMAVRVHAVNPESPRLMLRKYNNK